MRQSPQNPNQNPNQEPSQSPKPAKKKWVDKVSEFVKKFFKLVQDVIRLGGEIFHHLMHTGSYLFGTIFGISVSPVLQIFVAIAALALVLWVTFMQWWNIGVWVAHIAHLNSFLGGLGGITFGVGINIKQVAPNSWKLTRALSMIFANLRVNPNYEPSDPNSPRELHDNWHSASHRSIKIQSQFAFLIECLIVSFYVVAATRIDPYSVLIAAISLKMPETVLLWTAHTISLFGEVTNHIGQPEDNQPNHRY